MPEVHTTALQLPVGTQLLIMSDSPDSVGQQQEVDNTVIIYDSAAVKYICCLRYLQATIPILDIFYEKVIMGHEFN